MRQGLSPPQSRPARSLILLAALCLAPGLRAQLPAGSHDASTPSPLSPLQAQANEALEKSDYPTALKLLTTLAADDPKDAHLLYDLAYTQEALDRTSNAEATYRQAIAADPTLTEPHLALGLLLARTARTAEAHTELTTAATLPDATPPLRARAYRALARLDLKPAPDAARDELLQALKLSPRRPTTPSSPPSWPSPPTTPPLPNAPTAAPSPLPPTTPPPPLPSPTSSPPPTPPKPSPSSPPPSPPTPPTPRSPPSSSPSTPPSASTHKPFR